MLPYTSIAGTPPARANASVTRGPPGGTPSCMRPWLAGPTTWAKPCTDATSTYAAEAGGSGFAGSTVGSATDDAGTKRTRSPSASEKGTNEGARPSRCQPPGEAEG